MRHRPAVGQRADCLMQDDRHQRMGFSRPPWIGSLETPTVASCFERFGLTPSNWFCLHIRPHHTTGGNDRREACSNVRTLTRLEVQSGIKIKNPGSADRAGDANCTEQAALTQIGAGGVNS